MEYFFIRNSGPGSSLGYGAPIWGTINNIPGMVSGGPPDFWTNFQTGFRGVFKLAGSSIGDLITSTGVGVKSGIDALGVYSVPLMVGAGGIILVMILVLTKF
jgi:hypothetical protein